ncbi:MAG: ribonuclease Z [Bacteroidota bacterium]
MKFCILGIKAGGGPLTTRHPSGTVLKSGSSAFLFDCSEGTQIQLIHAGVSRNSLDAIFITHMHGDHIFGLMPLLSSMSSDRRTSVLHLIGPVGIEKFLKTNAELTGTNLQFEILFKELETDFKGVVFKNNNCVISAAPMDHVVPCFGFKVQEIPQVNIDREKLRSLGIEPGALVGVLKKNGSATLPDGREIFLKDVIQPEVPGKIFVLCGDTRRTESAVELAQNANVLIHEATFGKDLLENAAQWFHSTTIDAAETALKANVMSLYITHFSNRYEDLNALLKESQEVFTNSFLAEELVWVEF